ncbi:peptidylprolyl isomerase [Paludibacter sp.]
MRINFQLLCILVVLGLVGCNKLTPDKSRVPILEVEGKFLYEDQIGLIIPPNISKEDSAHIAESYIRKWATDILLYENAKRNVTDKAEIEKLLDDYRKSLTIHQYQQNLLQQRLPKQPSDAEIQDFYQKFQDQFVLKESLIKGIFLVLPNGAPKVDDVKSWVKSGDTKSLEKIEKYSLQNGLSYDYFVDRWVSINEILKVMPLKDDGQNNFSSKQFYETSDSLKHYMLSISSIKRVGEIEPFEIAKEKIANIIISQLKSDFILNFETELYNDAVKNGTITFFKTNNE